MHFFRFLARSRTKINPKGILLSQAGMTLIEIMIVLVIVATMGTIIVNKVSGQLSKAQVNQAKILLSEVGKSLEQYNIDCGNFPTSDQGLQALVSAPSGGRTCPNWGPEPYRKSVPRDPWNHDLIYQSDGTKFILKSLGKDGQEGGEGLNKDISSEDL
jgi:general secretion pathway protein G